MSRQRAAEQGIHVEIAGPIEKVPPAPVIVLVEQKATRTRVTERDARGW